MPCHTDSNRYGSCRFPYPKELSGYLNPSSDDKTSISLNHLTLLLESKRKHNYEILVDQSIHLSSQILCRNVLAIGQIGSGKTQKIMWPMIDSAIASRGQSLVILGTKGNEFDVVKALCKKRRPDERVVCINLSDARRSTTGWNPFACEGMPDRASEARKNAEIISRISGSSPYDSPYFQQAAARLMAGIILALEKEHGVATPVGLFQALEAPKSVRNKFFSTATRRGVPFLVEFVERSDTFAFNPNIQTAMVKAQGDCQHLIDRNLALVTSKNEFQFDSIFDKPTVVVLETAQDDIIKTRPFVNMFFSQLFDAISRKAKTSSKRKLPFPVTMFLDDFAASVGGIPECAQRFNMMRSMDARVVLALQSLAQLEQFYPRAEAQAIVAACGTKIYLPPLSVDDAEFASRESGKTTAGSFFPTKTETPKTIGFARSDKPASRSNPDSRVDPTEYSRQLLLESDVRFPPLHEEYGYAATFFLPYQYPFQAWLPSAFQTPELMEALQSDEQAVSYDRELEEPRDYLISWRKSALDD